MNSTHKVNIVRVGEVLPAPKSDSLGIVYIGGYQCVVRKDAFKAGDLAVYLQPDSIAPHTKQFSFLWDEIPPQEVVPERKRRITVRRFRGNWSEGLLLPLSDFPELSNVTEGDDVAAILGVKHYEEPEPVQSTARTKIQYQSPWRSWSAFKFWVLYKLGFADQLHGDNAKPPKNTPPTYEVENFKNYANTFVDGEQVRVTEKVHGSNARYLFDGKKMHVGSKKLWKSEKSTCIWRRALKELPWIEEWCKVHEGYTLYGEILPTQKGYTYGTNDVEPVKLLVFDVLKPNGKWADDEEIKMLYIRDHWVPVLYSGPYDEVKIKALVEGPSTVPGAKHIREGIVISSATERVVRGLGRAQLKLKSLKFLEKENA